MAGDSELCRVPYDLLNSFCITQVKAGDDSAYNEFASFVVKPASAVPLRERLFSRSSFPLWKIASNAVAELRNFMKIVKGSALRSGKVH